MRSGGTSTSRVMALLALGKLRLRRGDPGADAALEEALVLAQASGTLQRLAPVSAALAEASIARGDQAAAGALALAILELAQKRGHPWFIGELAYWAWRAGVITQPPQGTAKPYALEITGNWQEAADQWARLECPYERARALAQGGEPAQHEALAIFEGLGALPAAEALRKRLREAGARGLVRGVRASTKTHPCGLASAELKVLEWMCATLRNADIAQKLHRSVRTIDHHVSAILSKLGVDSRLEAVRRAERENWFGAQTGQ